MAGRKRSKFWKPKCIKEKTVELVSCKTVKISSALKLVPRFLRAEVADKSGNRNCIN